MDGLTIDVVQMVFVAKAALKVSSSKLMVFFSCSQSSFGDSLERPIGDGAVVEAQTFIGKDERE